MYALMQKFTLIVSLSQSDSNLKSKREHQIAIENTYCWTDTSSYRFDELFLRIVKIEHRIDQDVSSINSLIKKKLVEAQMTANSKTCMRFFFLFTVVICALWAGQSTDTGAGLKLLPKLGTAADPFRFMDAHCWNFTKQSSFFQYQKGPDYDFKLCIF